MEHFTRFQLLMERFRRDVGFVRSVARAACRARNPVQAAQDVITHYDAVVNERTSERFEPDIAHSLAGIARVRAEPRATARRLVEHFGTVPAVVTKTHPTVARRVALAACRATDPAEAARTYTRNDDRIVRAIGRIDPRRAHVVVSQTFRSHNPLR